MKIQIPLFSFLLLGVLLQAQVVIQQQDMPSPGDTIRRSNTVGAGLIDVGDTGPDHTWDFASLFPVYQTVDTFVSVSQTPFLYQAFFFFTANLAGKEPEFDQFPAFQVTDAYSYFKKSATAYQEVGFAVTLNGIPLPTPYDQPDRIYKFPLAWNSLDSSSSSYGFSIPGLGYFGGWKKRKNVVDGWGTLTTPYGTFETLRVRTELQELDSIYLDSLGFGLPMYRESVIYKWLATGMGLPLCEVTDNGIIQGISYIDSVRSTLPVSVHAGPRPSMHLFPNPAIDHICIETGSGSDIRWEMAIADLKGHAVYKGRGHASGGRLSVDLKEAGLDPGVYVIIFRAGDAILAEKLVVR